MSKLKGRKQGKASLFASHPRTKKTETRAKNKAAKASRKKNR